MPQIRVAVAHQQPEEEERQEQPLHHQEVGTPFAPFGAQGLALPPGQDQPEEGNQPKRRPEGRPRERNPQRTGEPGEPGHHQQPGDARQRVAAVFQAGQRKAHKGIRQPAQHADRQIPEHDRQGRVAVLEPRVIEQVAPGAAAALFGEAVGGQHQVAGVRIGLFRGDVHHVVEVHRPQNVPHPLGIVCRRFFEHEDLGVVVHREGFFGRLVVDGERPDLRVGGEDPHQVEAQIPLERADLCHVVAPFDALLRRAAEQLAVVLAGKRVTLRHAGDAAPLAAGGNQHVIRLVEGGDEAFVFFGVVVPVHLEIEPAPVDAAVGVVAVDAQGQPVIPGGFIGCRRALKRQRARSIIQAELQGVARPLGDGHGAVEGQGVSPPAGVIPGGEIGAHHPRRQRVALQIFAIEGDPQRLLAGRVGREKLAKAGFHRHQRAVHQRGVEQRDRQFLAPQAFLRQRDGFHLRFAAPALFGDEGQQDRPANLDFGIPGADLQHEGVSLPPEKVRRTPKGDLHRLRVVGCPRGWSRLPDREGIARLGSIQHRGEQRGSLLLRALIDDVRQLNFGQRAGGVGVEGQRERLVGLHRGSLREGERLAVIPRIPGDDQRHRAGHLLEEPARSRDAGVLPRVDAGEGIRPGRGGEQDEGTDGDGEGLEIED